MSLLNLKFDPIPKFAADYPARAETIAQMCLPFYCQNCRRKAETTYLTSDFGPFCRECLKEIEPLLSAGPAVVNVVDVVDVVGEAMNKILTPMIPILGNTFLQLEIDPNENGRSVLYIHHLISEQGRVLASIYMSKEQAEQLAQALQVLAGRME